MHRRQMLTLSLLTPLALAACSSTSGESAPATSTAAGFTYSPAGYDGLTISTDSPVERIAMDFYSAAALAPYGIAPVAVFGYGKDDSPGQSFDLTGVEIVGEDAEIDLEALAASAPDLIIAYGNEKGDGWTWWEEKVTSQVSELAPFVPVKLDGGTPDVMFEQYAAVASALGRDTESGTISGLREDYEAARQRLREVAKKQDGLTVLLANFSPEINYTAKSLGIAQMLTEDGLTLVGPDPVGESAWAEVSWEKIGEYPSDVLLVHDFSTEYEDNPVYTRLPAVKAGQLGTWDDKRAYTYDGYAAWIDEIAGVLESAQDVTT